MPHLQFNAPEIGGLLIERRVLKGLEHPPMVASEESIQRLFREPHSFFGLLEIFRVNALVMNQRDDIPIDDRDAKLLHQVGR